MLDLSNYKDQKNFHKLKPAIQKLLLLLLQLYSADRLHQSNKKNIRKFQNSSTQKKKEKI